MFIATAVLGANRYTLSLLVFRVGLHVNLNLMNA